MHARYVYAVIRWVSALALLVTAGLYFNYTLFSVWQTAAPSGYERPDIWAYEAYRSFGRGMAFIFLSALVALNIRPGWRHLRSKWNLFLFGAVLVSLFLPATWHFLSIDSCLDRGGMWDYEFGQCRFEN